MLRFANKKLGAGIKGDICRQITNMSTGFHDKAKFKSKEYVIESFTKYLYIIGK